MVSFKKIRNGTAAELIAHKKNRIVSVLLLAFAGLFYGFGIKVYSYISPSGMAVFLYEAALVCLFSACVNVFKDMHDIPSADVQMSMPLNSMERYFSRLLAVVYIWVLPFVISAACAFILSINFVTVDENDFYRSSQDPFTSADIAVFDLKLLLCYIEVVLFVIAVTVISQCCVGSKAESRYLPIILMAVLKFLPMVLNYSISNKFADVDYLTVSLFSNTSPIYAINSNVSAKEYIFSAVRSLIYLAVIGCGGLVYKKRDARSVGRPIVFTAFFEIVMWLSLLLFFTVAHLYGIFNFIVLFFAWLGSIILRVISSRKEFSFKKIFSWSGLYLLYYGAFLLFMFIAFKTGGFGALYDIPTTAKLKNDNITHISVNIYTPDDKWLGYDDRHEEYSQSAYSPDTEVIRNFAKYTAGKAKTQSKVSGLYQRQMFNILKGLNKYKYCYVKVILSDGSYNKYRIGFFMPRSEKESFIREFEEFDGLEFEESDGL